MILVTSAFHREIKAFCSALENSRIEYLPFAEKSLAVSIGTIDGCQAAAAVIGMGKVHAALALTHLINLLDPQSIILIGTAGAVQAGIARGDLVVSREIIQFDTLRWIGSTSLHALPGPLAENMRTDPDLRAAVFSAAEHAAAAPCETDQFAVYTGTTATADMIFTPDLLHEYASLFTAENVLAFDMEGFAAAAAATVRSVPFAQIRCVSDTPDEPHPSDFRTFTTQASARLAAVIRRAIASFTNSSR